MVIPLYFNDPAIANDDMSLHEWFAQIRVLHRYRSTLVAEFVTTAEFHTGIDETDEYTLVELFLPRTDNIYYGQYRWDLYSVGDDEPLPLPQARGCGRSRLASDRCAPHLALRRGDHRSSGHGH